METKHTPGPWSMRTIGGGTGYAVNWPGGRVCEVKRGDCGADAKHNARLIAAAPELLEALQNATAILAAHTPNGCCGDEGAIYDTIAPNADADYGRVVDTLRAAIAKATAE